MAGVTAHETETLVIGGGQAGLAMAQQLIRRGRHCLVVDRNDRVGDAWRQRWDSLQLFTSNRYNGLPGMPFPGSRSSYPNKDEVADYLEAYAARFAVPIRTGVNVDRLSHRDSRFAAVAGDEVFLADAVVVATGAYRTPRVPDVAPELRSDITQLHSSGYRNPSQLRPGGVLVVGAGNSGAEIALELSRGTRVWLSGRDTGHEPTSRGTIPDRMMMPLMWFAATHVLTVGTPIGRRARDHFLHPPKGIPLGGIRPRGLAKAGIERVARVAGVREGRPVLADGTVLDVANVVWCTGFDPDLSWIDLQVILDDGYPRHDRGAITTEPGLYFIGLPFIRALSSALLGGVGRDAADIAARIDELLGSVRSTALR
ncbi:SidA/IucD/PvdA family monooxygenase [Gordonia sp. HNM0687]|uniref:SidA/IucD/PvdA family monooxygenase n=1 Tax=Gordonia mangrovi TaxID=2665643 RepID=A0A6L7GV48_9ACTN|nr:NAD(P)-binding domain-containing protein [Gordonia mangrovi]MXP22408.1 SidA/IucD/PvdA family monooxygenase [Gordonia mangrovi]UVF77709.1 NAD(P)/FAD-dependent oxidoreductase [Gordonia mangrovi]